MGGYKHGHGVLEDNLLQDGLWDVYNDIHMGKVSREGTHTDTQTHRQTDRQTDRTTARQCMCVCVNNQCAEKTARDHSIPRVAQDEYALASYKRAADAWKTGMMTKEVVPVKISNPAGKTN